MKFKTYTTQQVANILKINKSTLLRWIRAGKVPDSMYRDGHGWRMFTEGEVEALKDYQKDRIDWRKDR